MIWTIWPKTSWKQKTKTETHAIILHCVKMFIQIFMVDSVGVLRCFRQHQPENDNAPKIDLNKVLAATWDFSYTKCCRFRCRWPFFCLKCSNKESQFLVFFFRLFFKTLIFIILNCKLKFIVELAAEWMRCREKEQMKKINMEITTAIISGMEHGLEPNNSNRAFNSLSYWWRYFSCVSLCFGCCCYCCSSFGFGHCSHESFSFQWISHIICARCEYFWCFIFCQKWFHFFSFVASQL